MKPLPWIERTFDFDFPVGMYPVFLERITGTPARIEELVIGLDPDQLTKRIEGHWSIQEQVGHLLDLEELHEGRLDDFLEGKEILRPADMKNRKTEEEDHNQKDIQSLVLDFRNSRQQFLNKLSQFKDSDLGRSGLHERLGKQMRVVDLVFFMAEHDDHHLAWARWSKENMT